MASLVTVEMGEIRAAQGTGTRLQACGLGACVGLCLYDPSTSIAVLAHIVLPMTLPPSPFTTRTPLPPRPGKCADTAVAAALAEIVRHGGRAETAQAALTGGAQIFSAAGTTPAPTSRLEIGQRNVLAVEEELARLGIALCANDTGGHFGRTVALDAGSGDVWVRPVGLTERLLVTLGPRTVSYPTVLRNEERSAVYGR